MISNKKILVTGSAGFIGRHLIENLSQNNEVISLDKSPSKFGKGLIMDIKNPNWIDKVGKVDYVFHLAAIVGVDYVATHPFETMDTEIKGIGNIVRHAIKYRPKKILFSSTSAVYGNIQTEEDTSEDTLVQPISTYGTAKLLAEIYLQEIKKAHDIDFVITRLFNVYGPYQNPKMVIPRFIQQALNGDNLTVFGDGNQTRDFTYISDVIEVLIEMATNPKVNSGIFNIGTSMQTSLIRLAQLIKNECGSSSEIKLMNAPKAREKFEILCRVANNTKLLKTLGLHEFIPLKEGLRKMVELMKLQGE